MNPIYILLIVLGLAAIVAGGVYVIIPYAVKKGIDVSGILTNTTTVLDTVDTALDGIQLLLPGNATLDIVDTIIGYAKKAAEAAEQMYKASQIAKDERNAKAKEIVYECLSVAKIERTTQIDNIVSGMIEAAVFALPETNK